MCPLYLSKVEMKIKNLEKLPGKIFLCFVGDKEMAKEISYTRQIRTGIQQLCNTV